MSSILDLIGHYQRSIERSQNGSSEIANNGKLLHCIDKLYRLPVTVDHLQATGIGKTVNSLRKYDGEVGVAAKALVAKWKAMVTAEEYATESAATNKTDDEEGGDNDGTNINDNAGHDNDRGGDYIDSQPKSNNNEKSEHRVHSSSHNSDNLQNSTSKEISSKNSSSKNKYRSDKREEKSNNHHNDYESESSKTFSLKEENLESRRNNFNPRTEKSHHSSNDHNKSNRSHSSSKNHHHSRKDEKSSTSKSSSSSSKHRKEHHRENRTSSSKSKDKHEHKSSSSNNDKVKENRNNEAKNDRNHNNNDKDNKSNKRRHSDVDVIDNKACEVSSSEVSTTTSLNKHKKQKILHDEIDSTTGTSFEDALGMMIPMKLSNNSIKNTTKNRSPNINKSSSSSSKSKTCSSSGNGSSSSSSSKTHTSSSSQKCNGLIPLLDSEITPPPLLTSSVNLKPLDPNIALELPTVSISNNYKPMPLNQTVMDCVFRSTQPQKTRTDAETLQHSISSKTMRTKVYSGQRSGQRYQAPKLFDLCIRFLQKNIDAIEYCGGYPYEVLRHVLERATPNQLLNFEEWNQYIIEDTDELWKQHVQRQCRGQKRQEMESWREMYLRCKENEEQRLNMLAENIKQSQKLVTAPIKKTQLAFVDSMVKPPRNIQRKQDQFGTNRKLIATPAARVASLCNLTPNAIKIGDVRLRIAAGERDNAQVSGFIRPKKAPLMAKTLQYMKGRFKR